MNRCNLTRDFLREVKYGLQGRKVKAKVTNWIKKWKPELKNKKEILYKGKPIIAKEDTHEVLRRLLLEGGCPLSIEGCFSYILPRMWGFPRRRELLELCVGVPMSPVVVVTVCDTSSD